MKKLYFYLLAVLSMQVSFGQAIFTNPITATNPSSANPFTTGQTVDPNMTVSGIGRGTGISASSASNRYSASGWTTGTTVDVNDYFEFVLTPNPSYKINFTDFVYTGQASGTGPISFAFRSSVDGFTANIGTPAATGATIDLSGAAYQNINTAITFRFYAYDAGAGGGTFSINDFTFNGTVIPILLPVNVGSFSGYREGSTNRLQWTTLAENNSRSFDILRSADGLQFTTLSTVASIAPGGNSTQPLQYSFTDNTPGSGKQFYRLRQTDLNGQTKLSGTVLVRGNKPAALTIEGIYPNPSPVVANIGIAVATKGIVTLTVADINGRTLINRQVAVEAGSNNIRWDLPQLGSGIYLLRAIAADGSVSTPVKLIKE